MESSLRYDKPADIHKEVDKWNMMKHENLPENVFWKLAGIEKDRKEQMITLVFLVGLGILLVYMVMASQFESLFYPLIIFAAVPMGIAGVLYSLLFANTRLSIGVMIGILMLIGIVVNNAIVLVDKINYNTYGYFCLMILFLGVYSSIALNDVSMIINAIALCVIIFLGVFCNTYLFFDSPHLTRTPLLMIEFEYSKMVDRVNELEFISGDKEEISKIKNMLEQYEKNN